MAGELSCLQHDSLLRGSRVPGGNVYTGGVRSVRNREGRSVTWEAEGCDFPPSVPAQPVLCCSSSSFSSSFCLLSVSHLASSPCCPLPHRPHLYPVQSPRPRAAGGNSRAAVTEAGSPLPDSVRVRRDGCHGCHCRVHCPLYYSHLEKRPSLKAHFSCKGVEKQLFIYTAAGPKTWHRQDTKSKCTCLLT